jgi:FkbM family methyltransferase
MSLFQLFGRICNFISEPRAFAYFLQSRKPSFASYRMCQAVKSLVGAPASVFDVGANQGQFAGAAAWWFPDSQIVSFEPSPSVFPSLQRNVAKIRKLSLVQSALGDRAGELEFFENQYSHASSALPVTEEQKALRPETANTRKITVPITTLDLFTAGQTWPRPLLLKLDVQGFEKKVLDGAGAFLEQVDFLLFECSYRALYEGEPLFQEMYAHVRSLGFELVAPVGFLENEDYVMLQTDLLWRRR